VKRSLVVPVLSALLFAQFSFAKGPPRYTQPGTPVAMESSGFEFRATLPHGWSFTTEQGFAPPPDFASACHVRGEFYTGRNWDRFLVAALRATDGVRRAEDARIVQKVAGHPAVSNRYVREPFMVRDIYINLSDLQSDSGAVWTFEGSPTPEGTDCELQFLAMIHSATITRP